MQYVNLHSTQEASILYCVFFYPFLFIYTRDFCFCLNPLDYQIHGACSGLMPPLPSMCL